jgi:nitrate reductase gamma subunit
MASSSSTRRSAKGGILSHRSLIAVEALLFLGVAKDWIFAMLLRSSLPNWQKVVLVMATTVGLFGGLFLLVGRWTAQTVKTTHKVADRLPIAVPTIAIHGTLLFVLFLLYASMLKLAVF